MNSNYRGSAGPTGAHGKRGPRGLRGFIGHGYTGRQGPRGAPSASAGDVGTAGPASPGYTFPAEDAPSDLVAEAYDDVSVNLAWSANNDYGLSLIERRLDSEESWTQLASVSPGVGTYFDEDCIPDTAYVYRISSRWGPFSSSLTDEASATTPGENPYALVDELGDFLVDELGSNLIGI